MHQIISYIIPFALAAVAVVLALGLINLFRGGSSSLSNKLMRWRVLLQFVVVMLIAAGSFIFSR